jgi:membrane protease YdiL (CAAX protease family)
LFYALAFAFAVAAALGASRGIAAFMFLYMFTPLLAVLVLHLAGTGRAGFGRTGLRSLAAALALDQPGLRGWPFAILCPPLLFGAVTLAAIATGVADYRSASAIGVGWMIGVLITIVSCLGEEVGWRGYLLPSLLSLGIWPAMLVTGVLHGLWHFPVILLTPYYHAAGSPWIVLPEFLVVLTLAGVLYGYLRLSTGSLWPPILLHASINLSLAFYGERTVADDPARLEYWAAESGVFTIVAVMLAVAWIGWRWRPAERLHDPGAVRG